MRERNAEELSADEMATVEALVRDAGDYVVPSDDLRPRTLESIRSRQRVERRATRTTLSAAVALTATLAASWQIMVAGQTIHEASDRQQVSQYLEEQPQVTRGSLWTLVDAFFDVREQRAESFEATSDSEGRDSDERDSDESEENREQNGDGSGS